jgi:hypothetical protein
MQMSSWERKGEKGEERRGAGGSRFIRNGWSQSHDSARDAPKASPLKRDIPFSSCYLYCNLQSAQNCGERNLWLRVASLTRLELPHSHRMPRQKPPVFLPGVARDDSDDELGYEDHPWEWIYQSPHDSPVKSDRHEARKRKRDTDNKSRVVGARMGGFECYIGECVLLKAEGSHEAWVGIITEFVESDEDGDKAANFLWFSSENEIRNREKKRTDNLPVRFT